MKKGFAVAALACALELGVIRPVYAAEDPSPAPATPPSQTEQEASTTEPGAVPATAEPPEVPPPLAPEPAQPAPPLAPEPEAPPAPSPPTPSTDTAQTSPPAPTTTAATPPSARFRTKRGHSRSHSGAPNPDVKQHQPPWPYLALGAMLGGEWMWSSSIEERFGSYRINGGFAYGLALQAGLANILQIDYRIVRVPGMDMSYRDDMGLIFDPSCNCYRDPLGTGAEPTEYILDMDYSRDELTLKLNPGISWADSPGALFLVGGICRVRYEDGAKADHFSGQCLSFGVEGALVRGVESLSSSSTIVAGVNTMNLGLYTRLIDFDEATLFPGETFSAFTISLEFSLGLGAGLF